jgi:hypothetical protein
LDVDPNTIVDAAADLGEEDFQWSADENRRKPQPWYWRKLLEARDNGATKASIVVYRSTDPERRGAILDEESREVFEQEVPKERRERKIFGFTADPRLKGRREYGKEMMVVVRRREEGKTPEAPEPPLFHSSLVDEDEGLSWRDVRALLDDEGEDGVVVEDVYTDVDEFV